MSTRLLGLYPIVDVPNAPPLDSTSAFETALGAPIGAQLAFPDCFHGTANVLPSIDLHMKVLGAARPKIWTMGYCNDLSEVVKGVEDASFKAAATHIAQLQPTGKIIVRPPHEANGMKVQNGIWVPSYPHWFAPGREAMWIEGWKRKTDIYRSVSDRFVFDWCVNHTVFLNGAYYDPRRFYPGADHVDTIGGDLYLTTGDNPDDATAIAWKKWGGGVGFDMVKAFAKSEGKRMSLAEWGLGRDSELFVNYVADLIESGDVAFHCYFNTANWQLKNFPKAQAAYGARFGQPSFLGLGTNYVQPAGQALTIPLRASQPIDKFGVTGAGCRIDKSSLIVAPMASGTAVNAVVRAVNAYGAVGSQKVAIRAA